MDISTVIKAMRVHRQNRTMGSLVELKPGDQLTGRVLRVENDGRVLMELGGQRALARIDFSVKPGQNLQLHVVETEEILHLQVDSSCSRTPSPPQSPVSANNPQLPPVRILITRDVKSQLPHLKRYLSQTVGQDTVIEKLDTKEIQFLYRSVERLLVHIEQQQNRAMACCDDSENRQVFVYTLQMPDQSRTLQLKVFYQKKNDLAGDQRQHRIALLLNLDRLGDVRVDLAMTDQYLDIGFFVENPGIQQFMAKHVKNVEASLTDHFDEIRINVVVSKKRIAQFEREDLSGGDQGRINLSI